MIENLLVIYYSCIKHLFFHQKSISAMLDLIKNRTRGLTQKTEDRLFPADCHRTLQVTGSMVFKRPAEPCGADPGVTQIPGITAWCAATLFL